jgi:hypothetical protein
MLALMDESVPWLARQRCIDSTRQLYEQCFAKHCSPYQSHLDEPGARPLNLVCYMWWEIINEYSMCYRDLPKKLEAYMINTFTGYVL